MNNQNNNGGKRIMRFEHLHNNSKFRIIAEPSRGIRESKDQTIYVKKTPGGICSTLDGDKDIILYPNDIVQRV